MNDNVIEPINNEKTELLKTYGADQFGTDYYITRYGTVVEKDLFSSREIRYDDWIRELTEKINDDKASFKYDKDTDTFAEVSRQDFYSNRSMDTTSRKVAHKVVINDEEKENYVFGRGSSVVTDLKSLCELSNEKEKSRDTLRKNENMIKEVVHKIEKTHEEPTPLEARMYYDYLDSLNKTNAKEVAKQTSKVGLVAGLPTAAALGTGIKLAAGAVLTLPNIGIIAAAGGLVALATALIEGGVLMFASPEDNDLSFLLPRLKRWVNDIKEKVGDIRVNKAKQRSLQYLTDVDKVVMPNSVTVEEEPIQPLELEDNILAEINNLVDRSTFVNPEIRDDLLLDIKGILNNYVERKSNIISGNNSTKELGADNMVNLRIDICRDIAKMQMKIDKIREVDKKQQALNNESKKLDDKIIDISKFKPVVSKDNLANSEIEEMLEDTTEILDDDKGKELA